MVEQGCPQAFGAASLELAAARAAQVSIGSGAACCNEGLLVRPGADGWVTAARPAATERFGRCSGTSND